MALNFSAFHDYNTKLKSTVLTPGGGGVKSTATLAALNRSRSGASLSAIQAPQQPPTFNLRRASAQSNGGGGGAFVAPGALLTANWSVADKFTPASNDPVSSMPEGPPQPERKPPIQHQRRESEGARNVLLHENFITTVVSEVLRHAKDHTQGELGMLDVLASYEEILAKQYPTMSKDVSARIYKAVMHRFNQKLAHSSVPSSTTMNQDLHFDFQGSFGEAMKFKNAAQLSRQQTQFGNGEILSSLQSEDMRPQKLVTATNNQERIFPRLDMLPPSIQDSTVGDYELQQRHFPALTSHREVGKGINVYQENRNHLHNFSRSSSFSHMPGSSFNQSSIHAPPSAVQHYSNQPALTQNSSRIKLPKLSFNDLLQDSTTAIPGQHFHSQNVKQRSSQVSSSLNTSAHHRSTQPLPQKILIEESNRLLDRSEMSSFEEEDEESRIVHEARHKRQSAIFKDKIQVKQGELYSEKLLLTNTVTDKKKRRVSLPNNGASKGAKRVSKNRGESKSKVSAAEISNEVQTQPPLTAQGWKFPKIQLVSTGGDQSEREAFSAQQESIQNLDSNKGAEKVFNYQNDQPGQLIKSKENVIDTNSHLCQAYRVRSLKHKAWRCMIIYRMSEMRKEQANKLCQSYTTRKTLYHYLQIWKLYVKRIIPEEKLQKQAQRHYEWTLLANIFRQLLEATTTRRDLKAKYYSTIIVLRQQRLQRAFALFRVGIAQTQIKSLRVLQATSHFNYQTKLRAIRCLKVYREASLQHQSLKRRQEAFLTHLLLGKALIAWREYIGAKRDRLGKLITAGNHNRKAYQHSLLGKALFVMWTYARHQRQFKRAQNFWEQWQKHRLFKALKYHMLLQRGLKNQERFIDTFRQQKLKLKVLIILRHQSRQTLDHLHVVSTYLKRTKQRKAFRALSRYAVTRHLEFPPENFAFLRCCKIFLSGSFQTLMEKVWEEFPNQRLTVNPATGRPNELLNYLGLSRNIRYRQFFTYANAMLRRDRLARAFRGMQLQTQRVRQFKEQLQGNILHWAFQALKGQVEKQILLKSVIRDKEEIRGARAKQAALYGFWKHKENMTAFYALALQRRKALISKSLEHWRSKTNKLQKAKQEESSSTQIYRQRFLTKYLSLWLSKLHISLKKKHLQSLCKSFQQSNGLRKSYFVRWRQELARHRYLDSQSQSITLHQSSMLLFKTLSALRDYAKEHAHKRRHSQMADQERRYWLARNSLTAFKEGLHLIRSQGALYKMLDGERRLKTAQMCMNMLREYKEYRQDKRIQAYVMGNAVKVLERKRYMKLWRSRLSCYVGGKMLAYSLQRVQLRRGFDRVRQWSHDQVYSKQLMKVIRNKLSLITAFRALQYQVEKRDQLQSIEKQVKSIHLRAQKAYRYNHWRGLFTGARKLYITYAFIVIQLKNLIARPAFKTLRQNLVHQRQNKQALKHYTRETKRKVFNFLRVKSMRSAELCANYDFLKIHRKHKALYKNFNAWRERYQREQLLQHRSNIVQLKIQKQVFNALAINRDLRKQEKSIFNQKVCVLLLLKREQGLKRFASLSRQRLLLREKYAKAKSFNEHSMFSASANAWFIFYNGNKERIKKYLKLKLNHRALFKYLTLQNWLGKAKPAFLRLTGARKILALRNRKFLRPRFNRWLDEIGFLRDLDARITQFTEAKQVEEKAKKLRALRNYNRKAKLNRQRNGDVRQYLRKKIMYRAIQGLMAYSVERRRTRQSKMIADQIYIDKVQRRNFMLLRELLVQQSVLKVSTRLMRAWQLRHQGTWALRKLRLNRSQGRQRSVLNSFAYEYLKQCLLSKSLQAFKHYMHATYDKRQLRHQALASLARSLCVKSLRSLHGWAQYHSVVKMKRRALTQSIQSVHFRVLTQQAYLGFKINTQAERIAKLTAQGQLIKSQMGKIFIALKSYAHKRLRERLQEASIVKLRLRNLLSTWIESYQLERQISLFRGMSRQRVKEIVFKQLKRSVVTLHLLSQLRSKGVDKFKQRAFQGVKLYSVLVKAFKKNIQTRISEHLESIQCQFISILKVKGVKSSIVRNFRANYFRKLRFLALQNLRKYASLRKIGKIVKLRNDLELKSKTLSALSSLFKISQSRKNLLKGIVLRQSTLQQGFRQWRQQAYLQKLYQVIYTHVFKERNQSLQQAVIGQWRRLVVFNRSKHYLRECLQMKNEKRVKVGCLKTWVNKSKGSLLVVKVQRIILNQLQNAFSTISAFSEKEEALRGKIANSVKQRQLQVKRDFLTMWLLARLYATNNRIAEENYQAKLMKRGIQALSQHRLHILETKYQMLRVIQHFSERRPEALVTVSKLFLSLAHDSSTSGQARLCSTALAKYVLEKWKLSRSQIRALNVKNQKAQRCYIYNLFSKAYRAIKEGVAISTQKRSLKLDCIEFYTQKLIKKSVLSLLRNVGYKANKRSLADREAFMQAHKIRSSKHQTLAIWYNLFVHSQRLRDFTWQLQAKKNLDTLTLAFSTLKSHYVRRQAQQIRFETAITSIEQSIMRRYLNNFVRAYTKSVKNKEQTEQLNVIASQFRDFQTLQRAFVNLKTSVKESAARDKYSRQYKVFTTWKYYVQEKKLLNKYLNECNYTKKRAAGGSRSRSKGATAVHSGPNSRGTSQNRRALVDLDIQQMQKSKRKAMLSPYSGLENKPAPKGNNFTLGQAISFPQLLNNHHSSSQDKPSAIGAFVTPINHNFSSNETDENFNSMNSPDAFQGVGGGGSSISPSQPMAPPLASRISQPTRENPRYSNFLQSSSHLSHDEQ